MKNKLLFLLLWSLQACRSLPPVYQSNRQIETLAKDPVSKEYPIVAWEYSYIGEYQKSLKAFDDYYRITRQTIPYPNINLPAYFMAEDARNHIIRKSAGEKIMIINEAHHQPMHRVFTESLLEGLYNNGFRFLALEALVTDSKINETKLLTLHDGYYTKEPQFGNLINKALALGYYVFGYEYTDDPTNRESGQAKNISAVLNQHPDAKILIHCGFNHLVEDKHPSGIRTMAQELRQLTGTDPFTIDQVVFSEHHDRSYEHPLYKNFNVEKPAVLSDKEGQLISLNGDSSIVDLRVIHPPTQLVHGRPAWLYRNGQWKNKYLDNPEIRFPATLLVYPYGREDENSVPVDIIEINNPQEKALVLPPGKFTVKIKDRDGKLTRTVIEVE